ncbi:MULE transposase domain [Fragilaria crotonensis]|nr:MULE transposase domain [Fragilaria crotonensis]
MDFCSAPTTRTRGAASHIRAFLAEFHKFALYFVCDDKFKIGRPQTQVKHCPCPTQGNLIDCGLFSIGVVLHIIDSIPITNETFKQEHMTKLRSDLATHLAAVENLSKYPLPCSVIRGCFPALLTMDDTDDGSIVVLGVSKNAEDSANAESSTTEVEVIMDGKVSTNDVSANAAESSAAFSCNVIEGIVDGNVATKESAAKDATQSPGMLKLLMEMISPASRAMKKCGGKILRFEEGEEKNDKNDTEKKKVARGSNIVLVQAQKTDSQGMPSEGQEEQGCQPLQAPNKMNTDAKEQVEDVVFSKLVKELKIESFKSLADVTPVMEQYQKQSGCQVAIRRSEVDKFRVYKCAEHVNCVFKVHVGKRRIDGKYVIKKKQSVLRHTTVRRPLKASDGRQWKQRRAEKFRNTLKRLQNEGWNTNCPRCDENGISEGDSVSYFAAYRGLHKDSLMSKHRAKEGYQQMIPYLQQLLKGNAASVIEWETNEDHELLQAMVIPGFMDGILKFVRPVISLDAAHMKCADHVGTLYIASVLSGANEVYPIGFLLSSGNEDRETWTHFLTTLKQACPSLCERDATTELNPFIFISDRDKGLQQALDDVFPDNTNVLCVKHIEANVKQRFGAQCAAYVFRIARTFSTRQEKFFIDQVRKLRPAAATYIESIDGLWKNTSWLDENMRLPPRYGIITSNTSESANSMFLAPRSMPWLKAIEKIIDIMTSRISRNRMKYVDKNPDNVVAAVWQRIRDERDASAGFDVYKLASGGGQYKVTPQTQEMSSGGSCNTHNSGNRKGGVLVASGKILVFRAVTSWHVFEN